MPTAALNALRREALEQLRLVRAVHRLLLQGQIQRNTAPYPEKTLDYRGNALNEKAVEFYRRHGVGQVAPAAESGLDLAGEVVMRTRYCLKHQLGLCDGAPQAGGSRASGPRADEPRVGRPREPLYLVDESGHRYRLRCHCRDCEMEVIY